MNKMCCESMQYYITNHCDVHKGPYECPDWLIIYNEEDNSYGIIIHDGGQSFVKIHFCPWCGTLLSTEIKNLEKKR